MLTSLLFLFFFKIFSSSSGAERKVIKPRGAVQYCQLNNNGPIAKATVTINPSAQSDSSSELSASESVANNASTRLLLLNDKIENGIESYKLPFIDFLGVGARKWQFSGHLVWGLGQLKDWKWLKCKSSEAVWMHSLHFAWSQVRLAARTLLSHVQISWWNLIESTKSPKKKKKRNKLLK